MDKVIHILVKNRIFIDFILYFIILYDTGKPIISTILIFKLKKSTYVLNSNLLRYFKFKTFQQTLLVLNSKYTGPIINYKPNALVDN